VAAQIAGITELHITKVALVRPLALARGWSDYRIERTCGHTGRRCTNVRPYELAGGGVSSSRSWNPSGAPYRGACAYVWRDCSAWRSAGCTRHTCTSADVCPSYHAPQSYLSTALTTLGQEVPAFWLFIAFFGWADHRCDKRLQRLQKIFVNAFITFSTFISIKITWAKRSKVMTALRSITDRVHWVTVLVTVNSDKQDNST